MEHLVLWGIAEVHGMETHIATERDEARREHRAVRGHIALRHRNERAPGTDAIAVGYLPSPCVLARLNERHLALVGLGLHAHGGKHALRARKRREQEVRLLRELVDGQRRLAHEHEIAREHAHIGLPGKRHPAAEHGDNRIIHVADGHHRRHHRRGIRLGACARHAQALVLIAKPREVRILMVEDLHNLLSRDHLLDVTVELAEHRLLPLIETAALVGRIANIGEHADIAHHHDERELPIQDEDHGKRAHDLYGALDDHGEAVVHSLGHGVHVVGEVAHDIAAIVRVEVAQRQLLQVRKEIAADVHEHFLRSVHHDLRIRERCHHTGSVDEGRSDDACHEVRIRAAREAIDHGPNHVRAEQVGDSRHAHQQRHRQKEQLMASHIREELTQRCNEVLRLVPRRSHYRSPPSDPLWDGFVLTHSTLSGAACPFWDGFVLTHPAFSGAA